MINGTFSWDLCSGMMRRDRATETRDIHTVRIRYEHWLLSCYCAAHEIGMLDLIT